MQNRQHNCNHGPDSFWMHDPKILFEKLNLKEGDVFADIGCGVGRYSLAAANYVGKSGRVYAIDQLEDCINTLSLEAKACGLVQIEPIVSDITASIPIESESCDLCFICTVLHSLNLKQFADTIFCETRRILKPQGRLFIVECKKKEVPFGPSMAARMSPDELSEIVCAFNFSNLGLSDLGHNYMVEYGKI
ncbi:MAG: methyltransferase domain-containing protein [Spirochaetales bacterium]|nr:methyltransferase domain-containing protein [Spirochaetales bacterium]